MVVTLFVMSAKMYDGVYTCPKMQSATVEVEFLAELEEVNAEFSPPDAGVLAGLTRLHGGGSEPGGAMIT
eukprot:1321266-Amorphochlora_amoeboformis.AAC.1